MALRALGFLVFVAAADEGAGGAGNPLEGGELSDLQSVLKRSNQSVNDLIVDAKKQNLRKNPVPMTIDEMFGVDSTGQKRVKRVTKHNYIGDNEDLTEGPGHEEYNQRRRLRKNIQDDLRIDYDDLQKDYDNFYKAKYASELAEAEDDQQGGEGEEVLYDNDYYARLLPANLGKPCKIPGVTSAMCVSKEVIQADTEFCFDVNFPSVCVPIQHFLWEHWTIEQKDFEIQRTVALQIEDRLMLELANPMTSDSDPVSGLELTSKMTCLEGYKQFTCRYNFPYCDEETGETFGACPRECSYFISECGLKTGYCNEKFYPFIDDDEEANPSCEFAPSIEVEGEAEE